MDQLLSRMSSLFIYPGPDWRLKLAICTDEAGDHGDAVYEPLRRFFDWAATVTDHGLEEAFTQTFDLSPTCTLEVGWHLYGEDYNRGAFMARLRDQFAEHDVTETIELPDHMTNVLPLLDRMPRDEAASLCDELVLPSLSEMRQTLEKEGSPFEPLLASTLALLMELFEIAEARPIIKQDKSIPMNFLGKEISRG